MKILFHGTEHILRQPVFHGGKPYNDYGYGFYCTENRELAKEWAVTDEHDGFANQYELNDGDLRVLDLNRDYTILTWLAVLLQHRTFSIDTPLGVEAVRYLREFFYVDVEKYDVVYGYRADDSYFSFAQDFISGAISIRQLREAMHLGDLGMQYVLKSRKAFENLRYVSAERALRSVWLAQKKERDRRARRAYLQSDRMRWRKGELYILTILDEEIKPGDPRLQ